MCVLEQCIGGMIKIRIVQQKRALVFEGVTSDCMYGYLSWKIKHIKITELSFETRYLGRN